VIFDPTTAALITLLGCDNYEWVSAEPYSNVWIIGKDDSLYFAGDVSRIGLKCVYEVKVKWDIPTTKENGDLLTLDEIGAYNISTMIDYKPGSVRIKDPNKTWYDFRVVGDVDACFTVYVILKKDGLSSKISRYCLTLGE